MFNQFETFYYPYTTIHSIDSLKVAMLYFDKVWILSPNSVYSGRESFRSRTQETLMGLSSRNMVQLIDPTDVLETYENTLSSFIEDDLDAGTFRELRGSPYRLYLSKIPKAILERLSDKHGIQFSFDNDTVTVPFEFGESVILNHALLLSSRYDLTPFTDERIHNTAFYSKVKSLHERFRIPSTEPIKFRFFLPAISGTDLSEIQTLRENPILESIRELIRSVATTFQNEPLSPPLWMSISKHLKNIRSLSQILRSELKTILKNTGKEAIVVKIPLTISIHVAISLVGETFTLNNNTVSLFVDSKKLLPDIRTVKNIPEMLRETIEGKPETVKSGSADHTGFFKILKKEED